MGETDFVISIKINPSIYKTLTVLKSQVPFSRRYMTVDNFPDKRLSKVPIPIETK